MWFSNDYANDSTAGGYMNNTTTQDSPSKKETVRRLQNVVPVVIRQIRDCPEEDFNMFGVTTQILNIVGILRDYEVQSTKATYNIEDHTGTIKAVWWLENTSETAQNLPTVKEDCYVQVFGSLRSNQDGKILMVLRMFVVEDANIITNHLLQVIHARLALEAMSRSTEIEIKTNNPGAALAKSMTFMDDNSSKYSQYGLNALQAKVYEILNSNNTAHGTHKMQIFKQFPQNQQREVAAALEFLLNEGHAYSTIDNDHFKATDIM